jgi:hypothetical protein
MDIDEQITLTEERLRKLYDIKGQLEAVLGGVVVSQERKQRLCGKCGLPGHQARTCSGSSQPNGEAQA